MNVTITPRLLQGTITPPPSKSQAHRLLIAAALSGGRSMLKNVALSQDIEATIRCLEVLGASFSWEGDTLAVTGLARKTAPQGGLPLLDCGGSGSTLRFLIPIALAVLGVIVLIIAVAAWQWYRESAAASARDDLGRIAASLDPAARLKALEDFAADAPSSVYLAAQLELARAAVESENWDKAAAAYAAVAERDPDSPLAFSARFNRADVLLRQGKAAEAATELETLLSQAPDNLKPFLNEQIGEAAEAAGRKDKAIAAYQAAVKELTSIAPAEAAYYQDRIAKLQ